MAKRGEKRERRSMVLEPMQRPSILERRRFTSRYHRIVTRNRRAGSAASPATFMPTVYQRQGNDPRFDLRRELYRLAGVDLTDIPGVSAATAQVILAEIGTDVAGFRNASAFASWLGLCPEKPVSGGKTLSCNGCSPLSFRDKLLGVMGLTVLLGLKM